MAYSHKIINFLKYCGLSTLLFILIGCSDSEKNKIKTVTATFRAPEITLSYSGAIQPLKTTVIATPADGTLTQSDFQYGEYVKKGEEVYRISSAKFIADFKNDLSQYLKAKNDFNLNKTQLSEATFLHDNQLISDDDFSMKQSSFYSSKLTYMQARDSVEQMMRQMQISNIDLDAISISDFDKISHLFKTKIEADELRLISPDTGVLLAPLKDEGETRKIAKGDVVKQGDPIALIGDLSSLMIKIKVNELTVSQIQPGEKVIITGTGFPGLALHGYIHRIDRQGEVSSSGLPEFMLDIIVPTVSPEQQNRIFVGMSAKVDIILREKPQMMLPITAVKEKNGEAWVTLMNPAIKKYSQRKVVTGTTTADMIAIIDGIREGEQVVTPYPA